MIVVSEEGYSSLLNYPKMLMYQVSNLFGRLPAQLDSAFIDQ